jgi:hypothetical protein
VDQLLEYNNLQNQDEILKYAYESQRGNQLLLITFFALKKMEENGFMDELEKNYGIFLEVDNFVQDLKIKLNEIKSFKALYEYVGSELGKDKTELEFIIEGYRRAKKKKYIRDPNETNRDYNKNNINNLNNYNNNVIGIQNHNLDYSYDNQYGNNANYYYRDNHGNRGRGRRGGRGGRGRYGYNYSQYDYY